MSTLEPNPPINEKDLANFATRHKLELPEAYKSFLLRNNGGRPVKSAFPIKGFAGNPFGIVHVFLGIKADIETEDLENILTLECQNIPIGILPIASNGCGDFICIDLRKEGQPVVFWDRKPYWGSGIWNERDLYPVAQNFDALLQSLFRFDLP